MRASPRSSGPILLTLSFIACGDDGATTDTADVTSDTSSDVTTTTDVADVVEVVIPPYSPPPISWSACGTGGWSCGDLIVPRDYARPDGPTLRIKVSRHLAVPALRVGPLLVNPGGPGGPAGPFARELVTRSPPLADRFDVYALDPRGTGDSEPRLDCLTDEEIDVMRATSARTDPEGARALIDYVRAQCAELGADLLASVGTTEVARDMDSLRKAIVETRINYLGASYGTALGAAYAALFPRQVRAFVLDAPVSSSWISPDMLADGVIAKQREFERYLAWCGAIIGDGCPFGAGELVSVRERWRTFAAGVEAGAVQTSRGPLGIDDLIGVLSAVLASGSSSTFTEDSFNLLDNLLGPAVAQGDGSSILEIADTLTGRDASGRYGSMLMANLAVLCRDGLADADVADFEGVFERARREAPDFFGGESLALACAGWAASAAPPILAAPDAPPMLVLVGERDPSTPIAWADDLLAELGNGSEAFAWHGAGHVFATRARVMERVLRFLEDPSSLEVDPYTCPALPPIRSSTFDVETTARMDVELRAVDDDRVLASKSLGVGVTTLTVPEGYDARWIALRYVAQGAIVGRRYLDRDQALFPLIRPALATDVASFSHDTVLHDPTRGALLVNVHDCDGQGAIGAELVVGDGSQGAVIYSGGPHFCRFDTPETAVSRCGRAFVHDLPPGRYPIGFEHDGTSFEGPAVTIEAGSFVTISRPLTPQ